MNRQKLLIGSIIAVSLLLVGTFVVFSMATNLGEVERRNTLLSNSLTVQGNDFEYIPVNVTINGYSDEFLASFTVSEGQIIKCSHFYDIMHFSMWQEGTCNTSWSEGNHLDYGMSVSSGTPDTSISPVFGFANEDPYAKEVHFQFFRVWQERNYPVMIVGIGMMAIGTGIGIGLKPNKLHVGYLICAYIMGLFMMPLLLTLISDFGYLIGQHWGILIIAPLIQGTILLEALPLAVLLYLWIEKGGGSAYLESWNMGKKLRAIGLLLLFGFMINGALLLIDNLTVWNFSSTKVEIEYGVTSVPNPLYFSVFGIACAMILSGIFAFTGVCLRKSELLA